MPAANKKPTKRPAKKTTRGGRISAREAALTAAKIATHVMIGALAGKANNALYFNQTHNVGTVGPRDSGVFMPIRPYNG